MTNTRFGIRSALLALAASVALVACGGGSDSATVASPATGTLKVALTDAPACGFDEVNVTVDRVRAHQSASAGENDTGWTDIVVSPARKIDLLSLQNGVLVDLGQATLLAGNYTQMRLVLVSNRSVPMSNTVKPTGGSEMELDTPSAAQSGLKLINGFTIEPNKTTYLVLDFDACRSIVSRGNGTYGLKPVIHMMAVTASTIVGYVQSSPTGMTVSAQKSGVVLKATQPDSTGRFVLAPLDPTKSPYDVVIAGPALTTSVIAAVPVTADQTTTLNTDANRMTIPSSASGTVTGNVLPEPARLTAAIRALQAVGTVPVVEVGHATVASDTGNYSLQLPVAEPRLVTYVTPWNLPISFLTPGGIAGKYKLEASATGSCRTSHWSWPRDQRGVKSRAAPRGRFPFVLSPPAAASGSRSPAADSPCPWWPSWPVPQVR
jgi:Domain of unknown function (DUF4382)